MTNEDIDIHSSKLNYLTRVTEVSRHVRVESVCAVVAVVFICFLLCCKLESCKARYIAYHCYCRVPPFLRSCC